MRTRNKRPTAWVPGFAAVIVGLAACNEEPRVLEVPSKASSESESETPAAKPSATPTGKPSASSGSTASPTPSAKPGASSGSGSPATKASGQASPSALKGETLAGSSSSLITISESIDETGGCGEGGISTAAGGCADLTRIHSLTFPSNLAFVAMAADGDAQFLLTLREAGSSIRWWEVLGLDPASSRWILECSWLDDGRIWGGFALDRESYYVSGLAIRAAGSYTQTRILRRFSRADCREDVSGGIRPPTVWDRPASFTMLASDGTQIALPDLGWSGDGKLLVLTSPQQGAWTSKPYTASFGTQSFRVNESKGLALDSENVWFHGNRNALWRFTREGLATGWFLLPTSAYPDLSYSSQGLLVLPGNELAVLTYSESASGSNLYLADRFLRFGGTLRRYVFDVSRF